MATINDIGIPGAGLGILHPKLINKFRVLIVDDKGNINPKFKDLPMQVISCRQDTGISKGDSHHMDIVLADDITNVASDIIAGLQELSSLEFNIAVDYLDGTDNVVRRHLYSYCQLLAIEYSTLDYAGDNYKERDYQVNIRRPNGESGTEVATIGFTIGCTNFVSSKPQLS